MHTDRMGGGGNSRQLCTNHSPNTNHGQYRPEAHTEKIPRHSSYPQEGRRRNIDTPDKIELGRLLINTETYPCAKRACVTLGAICKSRLAEIQIRGQERKKLTESYDEETGEGGANLIYGGIGKMIEDSTKTAGLTKNATQGLGETGNIDTRARKRGRTLSNRGKRGGGKGGNTQRTERPAKRENEEGRGGKSAEPEKTRRTRKSGRKQEECHRRKVG